MNIINVISTFIDKKVKELLEMVEILDKINQRPRELSGGQKQRAAIARALSMDPQILLCDEATSALDPKTSKSITALLDEINRNLGITIVVVTHQMSVLRSSCEEIAILEKGRVAFLRRTIIMKKKFSKICSIILIMSIMACSKSSMEIHSLKVLTKII